MNADIIVIGLGAFGAATVLAAARRGARVIGIDRYHPPHPHGSTHGESRVTREAVGEGEFYVPVVRRSHELWREIEAETGKHLFDACGCLIVEPRGGGGDHPGKDAFFDRTVEIARRHEIAHELVAPAEGSRRFPALMLTGDERLYLEPGAGFVDPEGAVEAQLTLARRHGAVLRTGETVAVIEPSGTGVGVGTDRGRYEAASVVLAAGAWAPALARANDLSPALRRFTIHRQAMFWFGADDPAAFRAENLPVFIWLHGQADGDWFYGFPAPPGRDEVKIAIETFAAPREKATQAEEIVPGEDARLFVQHVSGRVRGLQPGARRSATCLYTTAPDHHFLLDRAPDFPSVIVASACSGHGFKHSPALGEAAAELALEGRSRLDLTPFVANRLRP